MYRLHNLNGTVGSNPTLSSKTIGRVKSTVQL